MPKRARSFAPSYARKRARIAKYVRRRYRRSAARGTHITGTKGTAVGSLFRTRRMPYRSYKRKLYNSLMFKESYRSVLSTAANFTFTNTALDKKQWGEYYLPVNFYTTAGGLINSDATFTEDKVLIKGGVMGVTMVNTDASPIIVEWGVIKYKNDDIDFSAYGETEYSYDISCFPGYGHSFSLMGKMKRVVIEPGDRIDMRVKIPFTIINDKSEWATNSKNRPVIVYSVQANSVAAETLPLIRYHNLTFVADAVTANTLE